MIALRVIGIIGIAIALGLSFYHQWKEEVFKERKIK